MEGDARFMGGMYAGQGQPNGRSPFQKHTSEAHKPNSGFAEQQKLTYLQQQQMQQNHPSSNNSHEGSQPYMTQQANPPSSSRRGPPQHQTMYMTSA